MTARKFSTKAVPRSQYSAHERKAGGFLRAVKSALAMQDWDTACLNAAHCAISAADALMVKKAGKRPAGENHGEAPSLLQLLVKDEKIGQKAQTLSRIISYKHLAAYESRELTESDARELAKLTERFYDWAMKLLEETE